MDIPKKYKALVNRIRNEVRRDGKLLTREDISFELGLLRSHFDKLISPSGNPTEDDLKDLLLHFPELLESVDSDSNAALFANCKLLKTNYI